METIWQDLRFAYRTLLKNPGFTAIAVITLALGIGANSAIFSVVNSLLLRSLPYHQAEQLVAVNGTDAATNNSHSTVSFSDIEDLRQQNQSLSEIATYSSWRPVLSGNGEPERVPAMQVSDGYFAVMQGTPLLGRVFIPEDQEDGKDIVIVLSYQLWQRRFGADTNVIGSKIMLNSRPYTVIGVLPADFHSLPAGMVDQPAELYRPLAEKFADKDRDQRHLRAIGRLKPTISLNQAQTELNGLATRMANDNPTTNYGYGIHLQPLREELTGNLRPALLTLFVAVALVLLISCANVGNLLLAKSVTRQKEIAIRAALGADRMRLMRQLLTESLLLSLFGGLIGLLLALWGTSCLELLGRRIFPLLDGIKIDFTVLAFTLVTALVTGIVFGLAPALQVSRPNLIERLKEGGRSSESGASHNYLRNLLVVSEVAMALVLLVCAGLLIKSVARLSNVDPGYNPENVLSMTVILPRAKYPKAGQWVAFFNQLTENLENVPGVQSAGLVSTLPTAGGYDQVGILIESLPRPRGQELSVDRYVITPDYLRTMSIPVIKGRGFNQQDGEVSERVVLVSETMARQLWPGQDPIGQHIALPDDANLQQLPWRSVVGVVKDVKQYGLDTAGTMQLYLPLAQNPNSAFSLVVRTTGAPNSMISTVQRELRSLDHDQVPFNVVSMTEVLANSIGVRRFSMFLLGGFALLALLLAAVGIYGVISYSVTQRIHEIGIRLALGAQPRDLFKLVVGQGLRLATIGLLIGMIAAIGLTQLIASQLYQVSATDPLIFSMIPLFFLTVAMLASYLPARRAMKVDPIVALRNQ